MFYIYIEFYPPKLVYLLIDYLLSILSIYIVSFSSQSITLLITKF